MAGYSKRLDLTANESGDHEMMIAGSKFGYNIEEVLEAVKPHCRKRDYHLGYVDAVWKTNIAKSWSGRFPIQTNNQNGASRG